MLGISLKRFCNSLDVLSGNKIDKIVWLNVLGFISVLCLIFMVLSYDNGTRIYPILSNVFIFTCSPLLIHFVYLFFGKGKSVKFLLPNPTSGSFFVFASHAIILTYVSSCFSKLVPTNNQLIMLMLYFAVAITTYVISVLIYVIFNKIFPKVTSVLTGGR